VDGESVPEGGGGGKRPRRPGHPRSGPCVLVCLFCFSMSVCGCGWAVFTIFPYSICDYYVFYVLYMLYLSIFFIFSVSKFDSIYV